MAASNSDGYASTSSEGGSPSAPASTKRRSTRINASPVVVMDAITEKDADNDEMMDGNGDQESYSPKDDLPPATPPPPVRSVEQMEEERKKIRSMWELASIFDFIQLFNEHVVKLPAEFTADELETQLLLPVPGPILKDIHIGLLKAVYHNSRPPPDRSTWATFMAKRLSNSWQNVSDGVCPLHPCNGRESSAYEHLPPSDRVLLLRALCELRLDLDDIHTYIESVLKSGPDKSAFRLRPIGKDSNGSLYWYSTSESSDFSYRMYKETFSASGPGKKRKATGKKALPELSGDWETVATSLAEFRELAERLQERKARGENGIVRFINGTVVPNLEELERKQERAVKRQQRQAILLQDLWTSQSLAMGRSRRERKNVNYTFDEFDRSISDAIKVTSTLESRSHKAATGEAVKETIPKEEEEDRLATLPENGEVAAVLEKHANGANNKSDDVNGHFGEKSDPSKEEGSKIWQGKVPSLEGNHDSMKEGNDDVEESNDDAEESNDDLEKGYDDLEKGNDDEEESNDDPDDEEFDPNGESDDQGREMDADEAPNGEGGNPNFVEKSTEVLAVSELKKNDETLTVLEGGRKKRVSSRRGDEIDEFEDFEDFDDDKEVSREETRVKEIDDEDDDYVQEDDDEDDDAFLPSDDDDDFGNNYRSKRKRSGRTKLKIMKPTTTPTRRSTRAGRSTVDYRRLEGSDEEK